MRGRARWWPRLKSFSYSVETSLCRDRVWQLLTNIENWSRLSYVYEDLAWVGEPWTLGSYITGKLNYPIVIPFRYVLRDFRTPELIRYLADSPELGFANERTIRLEQRRNSTLIKIDAYSVGNPDCGVPGGNLGFLKMLTERWFSEFAQFCDREAQRGIEGRRKPRTGLPLYLHRLLRKS